MNGDDFSLGANPEFFAPDGPAEVALQVLTPVQGEPGAFWTDTSRTQRVGDAADIPVDVFFGSSLTMPASSPDVPGGPSYTVDFSRMAASVGQTMQNVARAAGSLADALTGRQVGPTNAEPQPAGFAMSPGLLALLAVGAALILFRR